MLKEELPKRAALGCCDSFCKNFARLSSDNFLLYVLLKKLNKTNGVENFTS